MKKSEMQKIITSWLSYYIKEMQSNNGDWIVSSEYMNKAIAVTNIIWECGVDTNRLLEAVIDANHGLLKETRTFAIYGEQITIKGRE